MNVPKITIAIDGYSSCGKSTLAKDLAKKLGYIFIDSGAMYRAITLYAIRHSFIDENSIDVQGLIERLTDIELRFEINPLTRLPELLMNGENVAEEIRSPKVSENVSRVAIWLSRVS